MQDFSFNKEAIEHHSNILFDAIHNLEMGKIALDSTMFNIRNENKKLNSFNMAMLNILKQLIDDPNGHYSLDDKMSNRILRIINNIEKNNK